MPEVIRSGRPRRSAEYLPKNGYDEKDARRRIGPITLALDRAYPRARTALHHENPFQLLVATILSARCTDEAVNRVTPALFAHYPTAHALAAARPVDIERLIKSTGFFRQKTKALIGCAQAIAGRFRGTVPRRMADLVSLPGVARKTANVVLSVCWARPRSDHGISVDTHVRRVSQRLALTKDDDPDRIEQDLMRLVPQSKWAVFPHQLVQLGRGPCKAQNPQHEQCPVLAWCPTALEARAV